MKQLAGFRAELSRLRSELGEAKLQSLEHDLRLTRLWCVAIFLATLALGVAFLGALPGKH